LATILDGKKLSETIKQEIALEVKKLTDSSLLPPGLAVIIVGNNPASKVYVSSKKKACAATGIYSIEVALDENITQEKLIEEINKLNNDEKINGILLQLPLPKHLDEHKALEAISPDKDVDGFHPINVGKLYIGLDTFVPCTPKGIIEILKRYEVPISGKNAVVIGRSNIVGKPIAALLMKENATVTIAHSKTQNLEELVKSADIVVAAIGKPNYVKGDWIKEGAVVVDVGINSIDDPSSPKGYKLVGDVDYEEAEKKASFITPVPGGVGPMTIAMLLSNTLKARKNYKL
jgi:methylenetetrahydrofolate dehydrogenase (NADP+)/methenyltetrahydrofolate cyclohydrolase